MLDLLTEAFRFGGGVAQTEYPDDTTEGIRRNSAPWFEHQLLQQWIPVVDGLQEKLEAGTRYADVGCGAGHALLTLAKKFPHSTFVGYDAFPDAIDQARRTAEHEGLSDRLRFELLDAAAGIPERYDAMSTVDVVHDATDPTGLLSAIKRSLSPTAPT